jgi:hypothetical protein
MSSEMRAMRSGEAEAKPNGDDKPVKLTVAARYLAMMLKR